MRLDVVVLIDGEFQMLDGVLSTLTGESEQKGSEIGTNEKEQLKGMATPRNPEKRSVKTTSFFQE
jgi:hypothetical protein